MNNVNRPSFIAIVLLSVAIPIVVAFLLFSDAKTGLGDWVRVLPHLNAILNSVTALILMAALIAARKEEFGIHRLLMTIAFFLGATFLISYVTYHSSVPSVVFGDADGDGLLSDAEQLVLGKSRMIYLMLLLSHIALSVIVVPLVLMAFYYALNDLRTKHRKIVKYTWPVWFYVSVSGVFVYLMIRTYYI